MRFGSCEEISGYGMVSIKWNLYWHSLLTSPILFPKICPRFTEICAIWNCHFYYVLPLWHCFDFPNNFFLVTITVIITITIWLTLTLISKNPCWLLGMSKVSDCFTKSNSDHSVLQCSCWMRFYKCSWCAWYWKEILFGTT